MSPMAPVSQQVAPPVGIAGQPTLEVPAQLEALSTISTFVVGQAHTAGLDDHGIWEVQLAVDEAATNIILHAYGDHALEGKLWVTVGQHDGMLDVCLRDNGRPFDPESVPEPDLVSPLEQRKTGGLGLYLMRKLMDQVAFGREAAWNVLRMKKRLPPSGLRYVALSGRIDAAAAHAVQSAVQSAMRNGGRWIVIDLSDVTFLSSSGLRALLLLARDLRKRGGDLRLCALQAHVAEVFHLTGFDQIFALHATRPEAAASFPQA